MFEAHLLTSSTLKNVIDAIKDFFTQATLHCGENGIQLQAMDNSQIYAVAVTLRADGFDKYRCDKNISIGVNLISMAKILNCAADDDLLTMKAEENPLTFTFLFESPNRTKAGEYQMQLIHLDLEQFGMPETKFACTVRMASDQFATICGYLSLVGNVFGVACTKDTAEFWAVSDFSSLNVELKHVGSEMLEHAVIVDIEAPFSQIYTCPYLKSFTKATSLSSQVKLSMSPDVPLEVEYRIHKLGHIKYYLFPKMEGGNFISTAERDL